MLTDLCLVALALVLCVAVVRIAYTSVPEDGLEF